MEQPLGITIGPVNPMENLRWDLKKVVAVCKPKNISELEAIAHEEWAKILRNAGRSLCPAIHHVCSSS